MRFSLYVELTDKEVDILRRHLGYPKRGTTIWNTRQRTGVVKRWVSTMVHAAIVDYQSGLDEGITSEPEG